MPSIRAHRLLASALTNRSHRRPACVYRPMVTALEGRALLSTFVVQNLNDSGKNSLRADLALAQNGDTITFAKGLTGTITLTSGYLGVFNGVNIVGPGAGKLTISGGGTSGVFVIDTYGSSTPVTVSGLTITGSDANDAGLTNIGGMMTLANLSVTANQGGGIENEYFGIMTIQNSEISGNRAQQGAGIDNSGTLTVTNTSFFENTAQAPMGSGSVGGAIYSEHPLQSSRGVRFPVRR